MAFDTHLQERISRILSDKKEPFEARKMMGGLCYMLNDKMLCGISGNELMARIGPDKYDDSLEKPGCKKMDFTGRAMKGYVYIEADAVDTEADLEYWLQLCLDFNPIAKSSKKKAKKKT